MSPIGLPRTVLVTAGQSEASGSESPSQPSSLQGHSVSTLTCATRLTFDDVADRNRSIMLKEGHMKRLKAMRKELDYIQETAWRYPPIETYIGH